MAQSTKTIEITNFGGRLTRVPNGDLNSGFAKFTNSWGYDPFSKPMNLTWFEKPTEIGASSILGVVLDAKPRSDTSQTLIYAVAANTSSNGRLYTINPQTNVSSLLGTISQNSPTFSFGASMDFYLAKIFVSSDKQINSINFDGSGDTQIGNASFFFANSYHALKQFVGKLIFGNGNTVGAVSQTATITSSVIGTGAGNLYSELNPPLPSESRVHDLDSSIDGNQLLMTSSYIPTENILGITNDRQNAFASEGTLFRWNGSDQTTTAFQSIPSYGVTALQTYLSNNMFFASDAFGSSVNDGTNKILTLTNNKAPLPNATTSNANFLSWGAVETASDNSTMYGSLYYFGGLDSENPPGLYRILRLNSSLPNGFIYQVPVNRMVSNKYQSINVSLSSVISIGIGKHYFSTIETNASPTTQSVYGLYSYNVTPTGLGLPNLGVYETQTQMFSKRIGVSQIRIYTEPTATGNAFQLDLIGSDGSIIPAVSPGGSTFTYRYGEIQDPQSGSNSLERINFNPNTKSQYGLGLRITNTGTTNMTIKKVEVDYSEEGR